MSPFEEDCPDGFCVECWGSEIQVDAVAPDPRNPPLGEEICLCRHCFIEAAQERILELQDEIKELEEDIKKWQRSKRSKVKR